MFVQQTESGFGVVDLFRRRNEDAFVSWSWRAVCNIRTGSNAVVEDLIALGDATAKLVATARYDPAALSRAAASVQRFRRRCIQVDVTLDFIGDAVNSRRRSFVCVGCGRSKGIRSSHKMFWEIL
jgi:hypothetical protein